MRTGLGSWDLHPTSSMTWPSRRPRKGADRNSGGLRGRGVPRIRPISPENGRIWQVLLQFPPLDDREEGQIEHLVAFVVMFRRFRVTAGVNWHSWVLYLGNRVLETTERGDSKKTNCCPLPAHQSLGLGWSDKLRTLDDADMASPRRMMDEMGWIVRLDRLYPLARIQKTVDVLVPFKAKMRSHTLAASPPN